MNKELKTNCCERQTTLIPEEEAAERKKYHYEWWSELDYAGKIKRLREIVLDQNDAIKDVENTIRELLGKFDKHLHTDKGIVIRLEDDRDYFPNHSRSKRNETDDTYF